MLTRLLEVAKGAFSGRPPAHPAEGTIPPPVDPPSTAPLFNGERVPVYPERGIAVPAAPPEMLLAGQAAAVRDLHQATGLSYEDFDEFLRPVLLRYAAFVHLLPASEIHHHCGQGGLLRHGLEAAFYAARLCEAHVFALDHPPSVRKKLEPRWRLCAVLGALLHDMGKPLVDVGAHDESGKVIWSPHAGPLYDWCVDNRLNHYYLHWRPGRALGHGPFAVMAVPLIVPPATLRYLSEHHGKEAIDAMVRALFASRDSADPSNPLHGIIKAADSHSVARDVQDTRNRQIAMGGGAIHNLAVRYLRVMHESLRKGSTRFNAPGSTIWVTTDGVFGAYPAIANDAIASLREEGERQVPENAAAVLNALSDHGYILPSIGAGGETTLTHTIVVSTTYDGREHTAELRAIKFARDELILGALTPPTPASVSVIGPNGELLNPHTAPAPEVPAPGDPDDDAAAPPTAEAPPVQKRRAKVPAAVTAVAPTNSEMDDDDAPVTELPGAVLTPLRDPSSERNPRDEQMFEARQSLRSAEMPTTPEAANSWLTARAPAGPYLQFVLSQLQQGERQWDTDAFVVGEHVHFRFPAVVHGMGAEPKAILQFFKEAEWIEPDPATPARATVNIERPSGSVNTIRFSKKISNLIVSVAGPGQCKGKPPVKKGSQKPQMPTARASGWKYITEAQWHWLTSLPSAGDHEETFPLVRHAFFQHMRSTFKGKRRLEVGPSAVRTAVYEFADKESLDRVQLIRQLSSGNNRLLVASSGAAESGAVTDDHVVNPKYDAEADAALVQHRADEPFGNEPSKSSADGDDHP